MLTLKEIVLLQISKEKQSHFTFRLQNVAQSFKKLILIMIKIHSEILIKVNWLKTIIIIASIYLVNIIDEINVLGTL